MLARVGEETGGYGLTEEGRSERPGDGSVPTRQAGERPLVRAGTTEKARGRLRMEAMVPASSVSAHFPAHPPRRRQQHPQRRDGGEERRRGEPSRRLGQSRAADEEAPAAHDEGDLARSPWSPTESNENERSSACATERGNRLSIGIRPFGAGSPFSTPARSPVAAPALASVVTSQSR